MQCLTCRFVRSKSSWRPSQWRSNSATSEHYAQCKVCDGEMREESSWSWRASESSSQSYAVPTASPRYPACSQWRRAQPRSLALQQRELQLIYDEALRIQGIASYVNTSQFSTLLSRWMELPRKVQWGSCIETWRPSPLHVPEEPGMLLRPNQPSIQCSSGCVGSRSEHW